MHCNAFFKQAKVRFQSTRRLTCGIGLNDYVSRAPNNHRRLEFLQDRDGRRFSEQRVPRSVMASTSAFEAFCLGSSPGEGATLCSFAPWCNGSTTDSESVSQSSSLCGATKCGDVAQLAERCFRTAEVPDAEDVEVSLPQEL